VNAVSGDQCAEKKMARITRAGFFPQLGLKYFSFSLALMLVFSFVLDGLIIPFLEDSGKVVSRGWDEENQFIFYWALARNNAEFANNPVWRSKNWTVSEKSEKSHRILVIGDSFVWGHGYNNMNDIWWRQLSRELDRRGYQDVEIIAAGMPGINTRLELEVAKKVIPKFKPDLVIWGYIPNDADELSRVDADYLDTIHSFRPHRNNGLQEALKGLYPNLAFQLIALRASQIGKDYTDGNSWEYSLLDGANWQMYSRTIDQTAAYLNGLSVPSFMMLLPYQCPGKLDFAAIKAHYDRVFPKVKKTFEDHNVRVIDSYDTWIKAARGEESLVKKGVLSFGINPADAHPNRWATHAYGVHAANVLEKDFGKILGAKTKQTPSRRTLHINDCIPPNLQMKQGGNKVVIIYPMRADDFRSMPLRKPFIELNLELPVDAKEIRIGGIGLKSASLYVTNVDAKKHFDDGEMFDLGYKKGNWLTWALPESRRQGINTINLSATVIGRERALILEFLN
jgi:hypothetical protein